MSSKQAKKVRQLYRREVRGIATAFVSDVMKLKPKYIPAFIWYFFMGMFIKLESETKKDA